MEDRDVQNPAFQLEVVDHICHTVHWPIENLFGDHSAHSIPLMPSRCTQSRVFLVHLRLHGIVQCSCGIHAPLQAEIHNALDPVVLPKIPEREQDCGDSAAHPDAPRILDFLKEVQAASKESEVAAPEHDLADRVEVVRAEIATALSLVADVLEENWERQLDREVQTAADSHDLLFRHSAPNAADAVVVDQMLRADTPSVPPQVRVQHCRGTHQIQVRMALQTLVLEQDHKAQALGRMLVHREGMISSFEIWDPFHSVPAQQTLLTRQCDQTVRPNYGS